MAEYLSEIPREIACAADYEAYARSNLPAAVWEYLDSGSADDISVERNRASYRRILLKSRVLVDVSGGSTATEVLGQQLMHPLIVAPVAYQKMVHPAGELASAAAAAAQDAVFVLSTLASTTLEEVAAASSGPRWFQLYFQESRVWTLELVRRAEAAGYTALMVTVDAPINGLRNRLQRIGFQLPPGVSACNLEGFKSPQKEALKPGESVVFQGLMATAPTWSDVQWLKSNTRLPIILKGIMCSEDAQLAANNGVDAIVVSNHGGRTLDTLPAPIEVLPDIARRLDGRMPILLDGGIRRGGDVFKALALGADAVMLGRPVLHALATAGPLGVAHLLRVMKDELELTMALCGCRCIGDIGPHCLSGVAPLPQ